MFVRCITWGVLLGWAAVAWGDPPQEDQQRISYYQQIRPILQANCQGCHQPAKASGDFVMTAFDSLLAGGESQLAAIVPGEPDESYLIEQITADDGYALMPPDKPPLAEAHVALIRRWIEQGAQDDTPANARQRYDQDHPPVYGAPPVVTSLDFAPDGSLLAIAGFHEVLLVKPDGSERIARLVGMSQRIESVRFSPDGKRLAVTGGLPGRMGELQIWNVAQGELWLSLPVTYDTVYGGSWSPDGQLIAFGCADNTVRAIEADTGREVVYMAAHEDWVRGTVFSGDGKSIFSAGRDMTVKMTDVATQRFVGNVTTHTPGVLRGGQLAIQRHPQRNELLVAGADGAPKLFQMDVKAAPASGGNPNQIREYEPLPGRVFDVRFSPDGAAAFAASSLDGVGQVRSYETDSGKKLWQRDVPGTGLYALACAPDGSTVAAAGADGQVRLIAAATGELQGDFMPFPIGGTDQAAVVSLASGGGQPELASDSASREVPAVAALRAEPPEIAIAKPTDYVQIVLSGRLADGQQADLTRLAEYRLEGELGRVTAEGRFVPTADGSGRIVATAGGQRVEIPVRVTAFADGYVPDFRRDVNPILSRLGCNQGTCHGSAQGRNGFKLSLRGYDALYDIRALTDDLAARRVNVSSPDDSLMLLKATAAVPHQGGQLIEPGSGYYEILRRWIADGAQLDLSTPRVARIAVTPENPVIAQPGTTQQMRVIATYEDGTTRDVTGEAFIESGNSEVAVSARGGLMTAIRRGEAAALARYEGAYAATTVTVMGDRSEFVWQPPETWGRIDELVAAKWQRMKIEPSPLCDDAEFLRRVHLDLTGLPPTTEQVREFLADSRPTQVKRDAVIDQLIGNEDFVEFWTNRWADLLQVNRKFLGAEGAAAYRNWIRQGVADNMPYDQFARQLLTASGSNRENPAASYYKILRDPLDTMENTTHLFLGVRFNCNKCHDHPFERWTQDQYYETAAFFARVSLQPDPAAGDRKIGGTAIEGAKPLYEIVADRADGEVIHDRTQQVAAPQFPFECETSGPENASRREQIAGWITSPDNPYFARSYVNRLWGYLLGVGIIEPLDDIRAGNPPTNPELLDHLTDEFIASGFDVRHVLRQICQSRTYQLALQTNRWNADDTINYSHAQPRRLPAEVLYDAICRVTGSLSRIPGVPPGTRAAALPDSEINLPDGFLTNLGRPARESACECERSSDLQLGPVMALISGPSVEAAISDPASEVAQLAASEMDDARLIDELFLRVLNRPATTAEIQASLSLLENLPSEHQQLVAQLHDYEQQLAPAIEQAEQKRAAEIAAARGELDAYQQQIAEREAELDRQQQERIAAADAALREYEQQLPERLNDWEQQLQQPTAWTLLEPLELKASNGAKLERQEDGSIFVSGSNGKGQYQVAARSELPGITGIKLEALTDDRLPSKGPGRAPNGNFVLSEFSVAWAPEGEPENKNSVVLQNAQADFSQSNYDVASAIDGKVEPTNNGWATSPKVGENRTAVFETATDAGPGLLTITLDQQYQDGQHAIGRFRIWLTTAARPVRLDGLPQQIADLLAQPKAQRTEQQQAELRKFFRSVDPLGKQREQELAAARAPRPVDPQLQQLRDRLAQVSQPLPVDPKLAQLRRDVELSGQQLQQARLTFSQDLLWALINSPAFLFNR